MKRWLLRLTLTTAALMLATASFAQVTEVSNAVNLSWDDCGTAGTLDKTFACNSNTGVFTAVGSYISPNAPEFVAIEFYLDMITVSSPLPAWWQVDATAFPGACRAGAYNYNADFTSGPFTCLDAFGGQASGGGGMLFNFLGVGVNTQRFKGTFAVAAPQAMTAGDETYGFKLNILRSKTTGTGACAGCTDPACIVLNRITVNQPAGVGDYNLVLPAPGGRDYVTWQGAGANCAAVPTQNRTWGQVKALYR